VDAYVYLRVGPGRVEDVVIQLAAIHGVRRAVAVVGDWDVMVAVSGADFHAIAKTVMRKIHRIEGITRTRTFPIVPLDMMGIHGGGWLMPSLPLHGEDHTACYVHIRATAGSVASIVEQLADVEDVSGVAVMAGEYDLVAEIPLSWERAGRVILEQIQALPGVASTETMVGVPQYELEEDDDRDKFSTWE
jgi:DNA-binding Lrp family transcriptional regulator